MSEINPMRLTSGPWNDGFVLDFHSISSIPTGDPYHPFETKRTELGELLYRLKYRGDRTAIEKIVATAGEFVKSWKPPVECIVPAPPSLRRKIQPVVEIALALGTFLNVGVLENAVAKVKKTDQMKNIPIWERHRALEDAIQSGGTEVAGKSILLVDDLIESGSTLRRVASVLLDNGEATSVYALVLTRTR